nr:MAG TPA: hypothetical protein [Caudoviricetes sp.]
MSLIVTLFIFLILVFNMLILYLTNLWYIP